MVVDVIRLLVLFSLDIHASDSFVIIKNLCCLRLIIPLALQTYLEYWSTVKPNNYN